MSGNGWADRYWPSPDLRPWESIGEWCRRLDSYVIVDAAPDPVSASATAGAPPKAGVEAPPVGTRGGVDLKQGRNP